MLISLYHSRPTLPLRAFFFRLAGMCPQSALAERKEGRACIACEQCTFPSREKEGCETAVALISRLHTLFKWQQLVPLSKYAIKLYRCSLRVLLVLAQEHFLNRIEYSKRYAHVINVSTYASLMWREFNRSIKGWACL